MSNERWNLAKECGRRLGLFLSLLPIVYVLSIGPAIYSISSRNKHGTLTAEYEERFLRFYEPILFVCDTVPPFRDALDAYLDLWVE